MLQKLWDQIRQEPVLFQGVIQALIALGTAFGLQLDASKVGAITAATAAVLSFLTRQVVTPIANPKDANGNPLTLSPSLPAPAHP